MSHKILTGNDCPACKDLKNALDSLSDVGIDITWVNIQENPDQIPETNKPIRSVPTMVDGNQIVATGLNDILEYVVE